MGSKSPYIPGSIAPPASSYAAYPQTDSKQQFMGPQSHAFAQSGPPVYSATPNPHPSGRRLLHVYHQGWSHRHVSVLDSDKQTPLYTINSNSGGLFSSKPHMTIFNATTNAIVGTINFHSMSSSIDIQVHGRDMLFDRSAIFSRERDFRSIATGHTFKWKRDGVFSGGDLKCTDENDQIVATFEISSWARKKDGKFELAPNIQGLLMDELMVTGIAIVEYQRRQNARSSSGAAAGAGAAGC